MTVTSAEILTAETVPKYLEERWDEITKNIGDDSLSLDDVKVHAIQGGNVNYAFCITLNNGQTIFLKQAPEFVAIFGPDGFPLTSERMQREMDVYAEWKTLLGPDLATKYLPNIYFFDKSHMVVIMEFLDGFDLLDHVLVDHAGDYNVQVAISLGDFMGKTHAQTHSSKVDDDRKAYLTQHFENREMRDIQLEFVFTKCYKEATDEQRAGLTLTPEFMKEVELLKNQYNGQTDSLVLTHGDLHPGSVMVDSSGNTKVIDPEFTVYGPPGLDVGSLLSGYCLGAIHQAFSENPEAVRRIVDGAQAIWNAYSKAMLEGGISQEQLKEIEVESVGFTVAEVCRTALEFAGGRKWLQFEDAEVKAASKKAALQVVDRCMVARHYGGMELLLAEMKAVALK
ncbi:5-methylthioribose kinase [Nitzschia inconspicua]|uniref:5-methylthioribose kinase n=1 Tax=Nitzschia inconspicua TaxID=303405 RepID=A0A9K3KDT9_9STRA|nr:5-methylthioribose kinase [Nitzschia inconspicua]